MTTKRCFFTEEIRRWAVALLESRGRPWNMLPRTGAFRFAGASAHTIALGLLGRDAVMDPVRRLGHPVHAPHRSVLEPHTVHDAPASGGGSVFEAGFRPLPVRFPR